MSDASTLVLSFPIQNKGLVELHLPPWRNELTDAEKTAVRKTIDLALDICFANRPCWDYGLPVAPGGDA